MTTLPYEVYERIVNDAEDMFREHNKSGARGQTVDPPDFLEYWIIKATMKYIGWRVRDTIEDAGGITIT